MREGGAPAVVEGALRRWFTEAFAARHPDVIAYWRSKTLSNDRDSYVSAYELYADCDRQLLHRLSEIGASTLILTGDRDLGQTPDMAREMARRIPKSKIRIFPEVAHMLPIEAAHDLNNVLREFVFTEDQ